MAEDNFGQDELVEILATSTGVAAPAIDSKRWAKCCGKKQYTNPTVKQATTPTKSSAHAAKSLYIPQ